MPDELPDRTAEGLARSVYGTEPLVRIVRFTRTQAVDERGNHYWRKSGWMVPDYPGRNRLYPIDLTAIARLADVEGRVQVKETG